jgi:hypothetical protein
VFETPPDAVGSQVPRLRRLASDQADGGEDAVDVSGRQLNVLGREGINRRWDLVDESRRQPLGCERTTAEDVSRARLLEVATQEGPSDFSVVVPPFCADVAPPDHLSPALTHRSSEPSRLRVVEHHNVARSDHRRQLRGVPPQHRVVLLVLVLAERTAVAVTTVEVVVNSFRDGEEPLVTVDDEPASIDADASSVGKRDAQHLGDPAAGWRGVPVATSRR